MCACVYMLVCYMIVALLNIRLNFPAIPVSVRSAAMYIRTFQWWVWPVAWEGVEPAAAAVAC